MQSFVEGRQFATLACGFDVHLFCMDMGWFLVVIKIQYENKYMPPSPLFPTLPKGNLTLSHQNGTNSMQTLVNITIASDVWSKWYLIKQWNEHMVKIFVPSWVLSFTIAWQFGTWCLHAQDIRVILLAELIEGKDRSVELKKTEYTNHAGKHIAFFCKWWENIFWQKGMLS